MTKIKVNSATTQTSLRQKRKSHYPNKKAGLVCSYSIKAAL